MEVADKIAALCRTELFSDLPRDALTALANRTVLRELEPGALLFLAGEEARGLYVIVQGSVRAFRVGPDGREQVIHVERSGATIAEIPVFDNGIYPSNVAADERSLLLFLDKRDVFQLCLDHPHISLAALKLLATRLRRCAELVEFLSLREVGQRLAHLLLEEAMAHGAPSHGSFVCPFTLTQQQMAARVGTVREVISRALARLQRDGLITIRHKQLHIPDITSLIRFSGISS